MRILLFVLAFIALHPVAQAQVESGLWYDRTHDGHGLDLHRAGPVLFGTFYSYDTNNAVEWLWIQTDDSAAPSSALTRYRQTPGGIVGSEAGAIRLTPVASCPDGLPRPEARALLQMDFSIGDNEATWCVEPLLPESRPPMALLSGAWYAPDDSGWGLMTHAFSGADGGTQNFRILYFHDDAGDPRWAFALDSGEALTQQQTWYTPYVECFGCPAVGELTVPIGTSTLTLTQPLIDADARRNHLQVSVRFEDSAAFERDAALGQLSTPLEVAGAGSTSEGPIVGSVLDDGTEAFRNVPYVQPALGELRWRAPQALEPRTQLLETRAFGAGCPQPAPGPLTADEDCLQLNIWRPSKAGPHPVMVWIHGGGFSGGSAVPQADGTLLYDGAVFARQDVVFVSINYRLGALGFLAQRDLLGEAPDQPQSGNFGLLDQIAALDWVQRNIAAFGGDPERVTVAGASAGGDASCALLAAPAAQGLFQRAIVQSGNCAVGLPSLSAALDQGERLTAAAGCATAGDRRACLRALSPAQLLTAMPPVYDPADLLDGENFGLIVDGFVLREAPGVAMAAGRAASVPLLIGSNADETTTLVPDSLLPSTVLDYEAAIRQRFPSFSEPVLQQYPAAQYDSPQAAYRDLLDDRLFACPARRAASEYAVFNHPVYHYVLTQALSEPGYAELGSFHGLDVALLFDLLPQLTGSAQILSGLMRDAWVDFSYGLEPGNSDGVIWPRYRVENRRLLELNGTHLAPIDDYRRNQCEFWSRYEAL
jgi:para-nitrobenzyl esterase